jgi:hypothetical protein
VRQTISQEKPEVSIHPAREPHDAIDFIFLSPASFAQVMMPQLRLSGANMEAVEANPLQFFALEVQNVRTASAAVMVDHRIVWRFQQHSESVILAIEAGAAMSGFGGSQANTCLVS